MANFAAYKISDDTEAYDLEESEYLLVNTALVREVHISQRSRAIPNLDAEPDSAPTYSTRYYVNIVYGDASRLLSFDTKSDRTQWLENNGFLGFGEII